MWAHWRHLANTIEFVLPELGKLFQILTMRAEKKMLS